MMMLSNNKLPLIKIGKNKRFLVTEGEIPFFWLGDTAWELFHRLNKEESAMYLQDRAEKNFNVVQAVLLAELDGLDTPNAEGERPLYDNNPSTPNEAYFNHVDFVIKRAERLGIYMAILPTWGDKFNKAWGQGPEIFTPENAEAYGKFLGRRYADYNNIIWIMGGDRTPDTESHYEVIRSMVKGIKSYDPNHLMSYHPNGGKIASDWWGNETWLDLDMFQTRHQRDFKEYKFTRRAMKAGRIRPVIDGEPGYENIPNLLNKFNFQRLTADDCRKSAYWNMFSGAAGHTYGCNEVWQMYDLGKTPLFGAQLPWKQALELPGSFQMGILKKLFESLPWQTLSNDQRLLSPTFLLKFSHTLAVSSSCKNTILVYSPYGKSFRLKLTIPQARKMVAFWFNPADGKVSPGGEFTGSKSIKFMPLTSRTAKDTVLVLMEPTQSKRWLEQIRFEKENHSLQELL
jgi:hypothetical protein